jgi:hypothetical protein
MNAFFGCEWPSKETSRKNADWVFDNSNDERRLCVRERKRKKERERDKQTEREKE